MDIAFNEARSRHVLAALSGGADSVALLMLLCRARDDGILSVSAAHFEHGIRGDESLEDAQFCRELCRKLDVPFIPGRADVPEIARRTGEGLETCARKLRHRFLNETADIMGCDLIALAHHMDDQAETVLMHLLRGSGPDGARGMSRISGRLYRPLLSVRKSEILAYLRENNQPWREDLTNEIPDNPRNKLRLNALPAIEEAYPGAVKALARYSEAAGVESDFVSRMADAFMKSRVESLPIGWKIGLAGDTEEALLRRILIRLCGPDLTHDKLREIISLKSACDIVNSLRAERYGDRLYILKPFEAPRASLLKIDGATALKGICRISCAPCPPVPEKTKRSVQVLDKSALEGAVLRTRVEGDRITPFGMTGSKSLSDYFTDARVDRPLRDIVPIIAKGHDVLWVPGFGISGKCALTGSEAVRLECEYIGWGGFRP